MRQIEDPVPQPQEMQQPASSVQDYKESCYKCKKRGMPKKYFKELVNPFPIPLEEEKLLECLDCQLAAIDPFSKVKRVVYSAKICQQPSQETQPDAQYDIMFNLGLHEIRDNENVQVRCIKINSQFEYEMELPPNCVIRVNQSDQPTVLTTNPLISSRRKDTPLTIKTALNQKNTQQMIKVIVQYFQGCGKNQALTEFAVAVFVTEDLPQPLTTASLGLSKTLTNLTPLESKLVLQRNHESTFITEESFQTTCPYSNTTVTVAGRGKLCNHFQCFDLNNYLSMNRSNTSSWRCPICKKRSVELARDNLFEQIVVIQKQQAVP